MSLCFCAMSLHMVIGYVGMHIVIPTLTYHDIRTSCVATSPILIAQHCVNTQMHILLVLKKLVVLPLYFSCQ